MKSNKEHIDYHVGLMRGYLLAQNPPTQILHALDVLLSDYRSKAGEVIGSNLEIKVMPIQKQSMEEVISNLEIKPKEENKKKYFWDGHDDEILRRMYVDEDKKPREISEVINRTKASISTRINVLGLRKQKLKK